MAWHLKHTLPLWNVALQELLVRVQHIAIQDPVRESENIFQHRYPLSQQDVPLVISRALYTSFQAVCNSFLQDRYLLHGYSRDGAFWNPEIVIPEIGKEWSNVVTQNIIDLCQKGAFPGTTPLALPRPRGEGSSVKIPRIVVPKYLPNSFA